ncbi:hypothetical protein PLEOSDRAFT_1107045 [Pleurotus ostreatus PC15]|uniref:Hydrophobin n=1 Tax=Pleurotus ostreatus (strain PC15) TaxID=1137138 RepID=A0A067NE97_PLEO1|nr:hypothetical protein PLEOSDRAFT_1107045 [Pleurotus ostreatus PC15]
MRFIASTLVAIGMCATVFQPAAAVNPGNNSLHINATDNFEVAVLKEFGQDVFNGLASDSCNVWNCLGEVATLTPCLLKCVIEGSVTCVIGCVGATNVRPMLISPHHTTPPPLPLPHFHFKFCLLHSD